LSWRNAENRFRKGAFIEDCKHYLAFFETPGNSGVCLRRLKLSNLSFEQRVCTSPRSSASRPQTMTVACGPGFTITLTENGDVWSLGEGENRQLGLGTTGHQNKPAWVGGRDVFQEPVVLVTAGTRHTACVTSKGVLYTWGNGKHGELGDGFQEIRLNLATQGGEPAVMVSCGTSHTVVLTEAGCVWTCGDGRFGKLGHGNDKLQLTLKLVRILEGSRPVRMSMVTSGCHHSVALTSGGQVFTWGRAKFGSLGVTEASVVFSIYGESEIFTEDRFVPTQVARSSVETGECFGGAQPLMIAAGGRRRLLPIAAVHVLRLL